MSLVFKWLHTHNVCEKKTWCNIFLSTTLNSTVLGMSSILILTSRQNTFQQAKEAALAALNGCPAEVIWWFINHSWCWMSAYQVGLTGEVAQWAVRKQKGNRRVLRTVINAFGCCS